MLRDGETYRRFFRRLLHSLPQERGISLAYWEKHPWPTPSRRYNVNPTAKMPILLLRDGELRAESGHWGLLPPWARNRMEWRQTGEGEISFRWLGTPAAHFNSRKDTVLGSETWQSLLHSQRCLIPADGFIEWPDDALRDKSRPKIPRCFRRQDGAPMAFAGLFDRTQDPQGRDFLSFNILTVEPNALLRELPHKRMPAILSDEDIAPWLDPEAGWETAALLLRPFPELGLQSYALTDAINSGRHESPEALNPRAVEAVF